MTKLFINDMEYPLDDGIIINDKKTEELDSAIVTVGFIDSLDITPLDNAKLVGDIIGEKNYVVNTWNNTTVSFNPKKYTYTIALVSEGVKLQKIICPNLSITQPIGTTPKTIKDKIMEYYEVFIEPQYPELTISQELLDLTENVVCPEYLFSRPTMYEVLNSLLVKIGCCADIVNHKITYKRLDDYGAEIDTSKLYYENDTQNLSEYANRLDIEVENAVSNDVNYSTPSGISLRADNSAVLNDDNMTIVLDKPIYDIKEQSVFVYLPIQHIDDPAGTFTVRKYDITPYIVEKSVYDTYLVSNSAGIIRDKGYKRNALYYVAGDNKIQGLTYTEKSFLQIDAFTSMYNILSQLPEENYAVGIFESEMRKKLLFSVEYKTSDRFRLSVEKETKNNATLVDNQGESQIDAETFGKVEQDKINRFGNKELIITATYKNGEKAPELGDYIDEYVLAQRELVYYDDFVLFKGYLYKHFVRKNLFYGLNSRKRFTQISDEHVIRNEIINYDLKLSSTPTENYKYLARFVLQPLSNYGYTGDIYPEFAKYILFKFKDKNGNDIINDGYILRTASTYACGKSNVLSVQMEDNFSAGLQVSGSATGGELQKYTRYVDNYGEFKSYEVEIRTNREKDFFDNANGDYDYFDDYKAMADAFPYISEMDAGSLATNFITKETETVYKDNREAFSLSVNFNFKDTDEVIIGDMALFTGFVMDKAEDLRFFYSKKDFYELGDTKPLGQETTMVIGAGIATDWYTNGVATNKLTLVSTEISGTQGWKSYGITDKNGNLILGINGINGNAPSTNLYLHIAKKPY